MLTLKVQSYERSQEIQPNFLVGIVPADDLAPLGARSSAGTVTTTLRFRERDPLING